MKTFEMSLEDAPFSAMEEKRKTIEIRLNDEKRKKISVGDSIQFIRVSDKKPLFKRVVATRPYESLENLIDSEKLEAAGGIYKNTGHWFKEISRYYPEERQEKYGFLVIELEEN